MPDANGNATAEETAAAAGTVGAAAAATARDQTAATAALQAQLDQAQARNMELELAALRAANPDLPDAAFTGADLAAVQTTVTIARAAADHVRQQLEAARNGKLPNPLPTPTGAGTERKLEIPANVRGIGRIAFALSHPGPGMTE